MKPFLANVGLVLLLLGLLGFWLGTLVLRGFGELIETTARNNEELSKISKSLAAIQKSLASFQNAAPKDD